MQKKFSSFKSKSEFNFYHRFEHELNMGEDLWHSVLIIFCFYLSSAGYPSPSNLVRYSTLGDATELEITKDLLVRELISKQLNIFQIFCKIMLCCGKKMTSLQQRNALCQFEFLTGLHFCPHVTVIFCLHLAVYNEITLSLVLFHSLVPWQTFADESGTVQVLKKVLINLNPQCILQGFALRRI